MVIHVLDRKLFRDLLNLKTQVITLAVLIALGISMMVASWSAYRSLDATKNTYYRDFGFADLFADFKAAPRMITEKLRKISSIESVEGRLQMEGLIDLPGRSDPAVGRFISLPPPGRQSLNRVLVRKGRLPVDGERVEVLVHEAFAKANRIRLGDRFTLTIQGQSERVQVVGIGISPEFVYALSATSPLPDDLHFGVVWIPLKPIEKLLKMSDEINNAIFKIQPGGSWSQVRMDLAQQLRPYGNRGVYERSQQISNLFVEDEIQQQRATAVLTPMIFLGIASFLVQIIFSRLIRLQRPQIATLKSLGFDDRTITVHYLKFILVIAFLGAIPGILAGQGIGKLYLMSYAPFFHFPALDFSLSAGSIVFGVISAVIPGVVGGWRSLSSVYRLSAVEAMRTPVPKLVRMFWAEKLFRVQRVSNRMKMILRNLFSNPLRLLLTLIGIGTSVAVLMIAFSWRDLFQFIVETQFQRVRREDISIALIEPVKRGGIRELSDVQGVTQVEAQRVLPVRLHFRNHSREVGLRGVVSNPKLTVQLDQKLKIIPIPDSGLMVSRFFSDRWGMRPGDSVLLETLEGQTRWIPIRVERFSDDLVGLNAVMPIGQLWKMLNEEPSFNVIDLKVDARKLEPVHTAMKKFPWVGSVTLKNQLYQGFQKTMGAMMKISIAILVSFALMISTGVIYNSVRVGFSERTWELASLRVLGFSKNRVFLVFLAEIGVQIVLSIIPGWLMGVALIRLTLASVHSETFSFPMVLEAHTFARSALILLVSNLISIAVVRTMVNKMNLVESLKVRE